MGLKALLTVDLNNLSGADASKKRQEFYDQLIKRQWAKLPKLTTAWQCHFQDSVGEAGAIATAKKDVADSAAAAGIASYNAAVEVGPNFPTEF